MQKACEYLAMNKTLSYKYLAHDLDRPLSHSAPAAISAHDMVMDEYNQDLSGVGLGYEAETADPSVDHTAMLPLPRSIPFEVLNRIFEHSTSSDTLPLSPCILSLVCRLWHDVMYACPRLWAHITLLPSTTLASLAPRLKHSKRAQLHITFTANSVRAGRLTTNELKRVLVQSETPELDVLSNGGAIQRWTSLVIDESHMLTVLRHLVQSCSQPNAKSYRALSSLRSITILPHTPRSPVPSLEYRYSPWDPLEHSRWGRILPSLTHLRLISLKEPLWSLLRPTLKTLDVAVDLRALREDLDDALKAVTLLDRNRLYRKLSSLHWLEELSLHHAPHLYGDRLAGIRLAGITLGPPRPIRPGRSVFVHMFSNFPNLRNVTLSSPPEELAGPINQLQHSAPCWETLRIFLAPDEDAEDISGLTPAEQVSDAASADIISHT